MEQVKKLVKFGIGVTPIGLVVLLVKLCQIVALPKLAFSLAINAQVPRRVTEIPIYYGMHKIVNDDSPLARLSFFLGAENIEPGELEAWRALCSQRKCIVEIGANIGIFTVVGGAATSGHYHAFEPHPQGYKSLKNNLDLNNLKVKSHERAVVGVGGGDSIDLHIPIIDTGKISTGGFITSADGVDRESCEAHRVHTTKVDQLPDKIDLLKIDVEGAELEILRDLEAILSLNRSLILVEVRRPERTAELRSWISSYCSKYDYQIYAMNIEQQEIATKDISTVRLQQAYGTRDIILTPK